MIETRNELVRVDRADLVSGEHTLICRPGENAALHGSDYFVIEPASDWRIGWFLDEPDARHGNIAAVIRDGESTDAQYAVSPYAVSGLLTLSVYALGGAFRVVKREEGVAAVENVLDQLCDPWNDGRATIDVPLGFSLQVLDSSRIEFWRRQPRGAAAH